MSDDTKIISLSDADLTALKFLGPDAPQGVIDFIQTVRKVPQYLDWVTVFQLSCLSDQLKYHQSAPPSSTSLTSREITLLSHASESTVADEDYISPFESKYFYHGVSDDPPPLFQRSDVKQRPYPIPEETPQERHSAIPVKTAHSANHPILKNQLWKESVAPEITALLKEETRGIRVSTILPVRFSAADEEGKDVFDDHTVLWISVHPNTTKKAAQCRDANAPILAIFAKYGVRESDVAVHWIEGAVESLAGDGPPLTGSAGLSLASWASPSLRRRWRTRTRRARLGFTFTVGRTSRERGAGRSWRSRTNMSCPGRPRRTTSSLAVAAGKLGDGGQFAEQLAELVANPDEDNAAGYQEDVERKEADRKRAKADVGILEDFLKLLKSTWSDAVPDRIVGWVDWAPKVASNVDCRRYTRDIAVIALDEDKFVKNFKGNFIYLAGKFTRDEIIACFCPDPANRPGFEYPKNHLFRLSGFVDAAAPSSPYSLDKNDNPCFTGTVAKVGQSTDLTFGRQSELEAYTCRDHLRAGKSESWEVAVLNWGCGGNSMHGDFSAKGDSGAAIFNAEGKVVAILHSGLTGPRHCGHGGMSTHVTFGTPGHFVEQLVRERYPDADFSRTKFADDDEIAAA